MKKLRMLLNIRFLIHLLIATILVIGIIWATLKLLDYYTMHGQSIAVPDFSGLKADEIEMLSMDKNLRFEIVDSVYVASKAKGTAVAQDPPAASLVKKNRTIYITMNSFHPPRIAMPRLVDRSMREVIIITQNMGLNIGKTTYIPDICTGCVLRQFYKNKEIEEGTMIPKDATIDVVVGLGISSDKIRVPLLIGLKMDSVQAILQQYLLKLGGESYDPNSVLTLEDTLNAKVYYQDPVYSENSYIPLGSSVNLRFTVDTSLIDNKIRLNYVNDTTIITDSSHVNPEPPE